MTQVKKSPDNPLDNPEKFEPCRCPLCSKCQRHIVDRWCIYGGPFGGYRSSDGKHPPHHQAS